MDMALYSSLMIVVKIETYLSIKSLKA